MALDNFLPAIFRRKPERQPWDERLPSGVAAMDLGIPEWQRRWMGLDAQPEAQNSPNNILQLEPTNSYALAQEPTAVKSPTLPTPAPVGLPPEPNPYSAPANIAAPVPTMRELGAAPTMTRLDKSGRPQETIGGTPSERIMAERQAIENYDPEAHKPKGWWNRFLKPALMKAGIGFMYGGLGGALGGAGEGLIEAGFAPGRANRLWKERQMARSDQQIKNVYDQAKEQAQVESTRATTELNKERTKQLRNPKARNVQLGTAVLPDGRTVQMERDPQSGKWAVSTMNGEPIVREAAGPAKKKVTVNVPGVGDLEVSPESALGYYGAVGSREETRRQKGEEATFTNEQLDQNITDAQGEISRIESRMKDIPMEIESTDIYGETKKVPNPEYTEHKNRRDSLVNDIRRWRADRKAVGSSRSSPPITKPKLKSDPLGLYK